MEKKYFNDLLFLTRHSRAGYIFLYIKGMYIREIDIYVYIYYEKYIIDL